MEALLGLVLLVIPLWKICQRAGLNPALSVLAIVPLFGLAIVAGILAFKSWPATRTAVPATEV